MKATKALVLTLLLLVAATHVTAAAPAKPMPDAVSDPAASSAPPLRLVKENAPADEKTEAPKLIRENNIYIPYKDLVKIFEKKGRGIFLPYEEFLRLWHAAQPKPPAPTPDKPPADAVIRGGHYKGTVNGNTATFTVTFDVEALKKGWSELAIPLSGIALEDVKLSNPKALFSAKGKGYAIFLPGPGRYEAALTFSVRVAKEPGKQTIAFNVPQVAVSRLTLTIPEEEVRVDVQPMLAVTQTATVEKKTQVLAFLGNAGQVTVSWMPPAGKLTEDGALLLASQSIAAYLGERILRLSTDIDYTILRGEADSIKIRVPADTRLLAVKGDNIREWSEDKGFLTVHFHAALKSAAGAKASTYRLSLNFERILQDIPETLALPFPVAQDVMRESGWVVFNHDSGLNVRITQATGLSQLDKNEVPSQLRAQLGVGFRYLAHPLTLDLAIEKITPVIQSYTTSVVSLGTEEDVWSGHIDYTIKKAGVFKLALKFPERWKITSMGDKNTVEDVQTADPVDGMQTVTVNLTAKGLGQFRLPFKLAARGSANAKSVTLSPPVVLDTKQDHGLFGVSAPKAFHITTEERKDMTSADVEQLFKAGLMNQLDSAASMPLTYGYRTSDATVKVGLEAKKTEIDALTQHLIEISDGGIKVTHILDMTILYAAVDKLTFQAPSALDKSLAIEAKEKKEVRTVTSDNGWTTWEVTLQAPTLGAVSLTLTHDLELKALAPGQPFTYAVPLVRTEVTGDTNGYVAIRKEGTLQIDPEPASMESIDAGDLPDKLRRPQIYGAFRYFTQDPTLSLKLTRYEYQPLATTVVNLLWMESTLSEERRLHTQAVLMVQNTERQYLEIEFPDNVKIFSVTVNQKTQKPRQRKQVQEPGQDKQDRNTYLIQIPTSAGPAGTFPVALVYEEILPGGPLGSFGQVELTTPKIMENIPVIKTEWALFLSPDYSYLGWDGQLKPKFNRENGLWFRFKDIINDAINAGNRVTPVHETRKQTKGQRPIQPPAALIIEQPKQDFVPHNFESLAPAGKLRFMFISRTLFSFLDFVAFALLFALTALLLFKTKACPIAIGGFSLLLPLVLVWFTQGPVVEIFTSMLAGGALAYVLLMLRGTKNFMGRHRKRRLANAPDPFIENAQGDKAEAPQQESGAAEDKPDAAGDKTSENKDKPNNGGHTDDDSVITDDPERS